MSATEVRESVSRSGWVKVESLRDRIATIRMGGPFGPTWIARLANGLASMRNSIERAHATRTRDGDWTAELDVAALDAGSAPDRIPFLELVSSASVPDRKPLSITRYELRHVRDHGGTLKLSLEAADALGFLGNLLASLAMIGLFPVELVVETRAGRAYDVLFLGGVGGVDPCDKAREALDRLMVTSIKRSQPPR